MALAAVGDAPACASVLGLDKSSGCVSCYSVALSSSPFLSLPGRWQESCGAPLLVLYCPEQMGLFGLSLPCELGELNPVLRWSCHLQW